MSSYYIASFVDYFGRKIQAEWSEAIWMGHLKKHPQLINPKNCSNMIESTVKEPHVVMEGSRPGSDELAVVYYRELRRHQHFIAYIKVEKYGEQRQISYKYSELGSHSQE